MKKAIFGAALATILGVTATAAFAQEASPPAPQMHGESPRGDGAPPHRAMGPMMGPRGPSFAVINDLEQLRRL